MEKTWSAAEENTQSTEMAMEETATVSEEKFNADEGAENLIDTPVTAECGEMEASANGGIEEEITEAQAAAIAHAVSVAVDTALAEQVSVTVARAVSVAVEEAMAAAVASALEQAVTTAEERVKAHATAEATEAAEHRLLSHIRACGQRPSENGMGSGGAGVRMHPAVHHLTRKDRAALARRAERGETVHL